MVRTSSSVRRHRVEQELGVRGGVALLVLLFSTIYDMSTGSATHPVLRGVTLAGLFINVPYFFAARTDRWPKAQAYARLLLDVAFITTGLYAVGGLAAAQYLAVYMIVPVYSAIVFSSVACLLATIAGIAGYVLIIGLQTFGVLAMPPLPPKAWAAALFNLMMLGIVGSLAAVLAEAYRESRRRLAALYRELEKAHDESMRLNAEIQRAARVYVLGEVVAGVVHEIRNVLQAGLGHLLLARRKAGAGATQLKRHLDEVEFSCESAMRVVRHALEMARDPSADKQIVSVIPLVERVVGLKGYDTRRRGIDLRVEFPADFPKISSAPFQLQQVLLNLVVNAEDAVAAAPGEKSIVVAGVSDPERAIIEVRDSGPGIRADVLPRIFEPFYTTKADGTGLGLAISAGIVQNAGGIMTAHNRPDSGAVFRLSFPIA